MKSFFVSLMFIVTSVPAVAAMDPASLFVDQTLKEAHQALEEKDDTDRLNSMCGVLTRRLGNEYIANVWMDTYGELSREAQAAQIFRSMIPSIMITKAIPVLGGGNDGTVTVDPKAQPRGDGVYAVEVTIATGGRDHKGIAVVKESGTNFNLIDAEYMGLSAVNYMGRDFQQFMKREFDKDPINSLPVTALIQHITSQSDYVNCP